MINTHEVDKVNTNSTARTVRNSILSLATVVAFSLPLAVSAGATDSADGNRSLLNSEWKLEVSNEPEAVYGKLKSQSHEVCGSSSRYITGDLRRVAQIDECYQGTLEAAVLRLDNAEVIALHQN
jgi:UrcA family protein